MLPRDWSPKMVSKFFRRRFPARQARSSEHWKQTCVAPHGHPGVLRWCLSPRSDSRFSRRCASGGSVDATQMELSASSVQVPSTIPASSGAVRRLVLVNSSNHARSTVPELDLTILDSESDVASANSAPSPHTSREPRSDTSAFDPNPEVFLESATDSIGCESDTESLAGSEVVEEVSLKDGVSQTPRVWQDQNLWTSGSPRSQQHSVTLMRSI